MNGQRQLIQCLKTQAFISVLLQMHKLVLDKFDVNMFNKKLFEL